MQEKRHYKLYKSGKQWVTCALTGVAVVAGLAISDLSQTTSSAHAAQVRVSKADLQKQLGWSTNYKLTDSNKAQYAQLQANIAAAKALMNNRRATPAQIKAAIDKLHNTGLIMIKTSQDALIKQLGWSTAYNPDNVGAKEYAQLQAKVKAAQALIKSGKATAAQLEAIRNDLHTTGVVVAKTEPVVAAQKLEQQLGWSTGYTQDNLSPEQYQALQAKIKTAKALLASGKATAADLRNIQASLHATGVTIVETKSVAASSAAASSAAASSAAASSAAAKSAADAAASEAAKQPVYVPPVYVPPVTVPTKPVLSETAQTFTDKIKKIVDIYGGKGEAADKPTLLQIKVGQEISDYKYNQLNLYNGIMTDVLKIDPKTATDGELNNAIGNMNQLISEPIENAKTILEPYQAGSQSVAYMDLATALMQFADMNQLGSVNSHYPDKIFSITDFSGKSPEDSENTINDINQKITDMLNLLAAPNAPIGDLNNAVTELKSLGNPLRGLRVTTQRAHERTQAQTLLKQYNQDIKTKYAALPVDQSDFLTKVSVKSNSSAEMQNVVKNYDMLIEKFSNMNAQFEGPNTIASLKEVQELGDKLTVAAATLAPYSGDIESIEQHVAKDDDELQTTIQHAYAAFLPFGELSMNANDTVTEEPGVTDSISQELKMLINNTRWNDTLFNGSITIWRLSEALLIRTGDHLNDTHDQAGHAITSIKNQVATIKANLVAAGYTVADTDDISIMKFKEDYEGAEYAKAAHALEAAINGLLSAYQTANALTYKQADPQANSLTQLLAVAPIPAGKAKILVDATPAEKDAYKQAFEKAQQAVKNGTDIDNATSAFRQAITTLYQSVAQRELDSIDITKNENAFLNNNQAYQPAVRLLKLALAKPTDLSQLINAYDNLNDALGTSTGRYVGVVSGINNPNITSAATFTAMFDTNQSTPWAPYTLKDSVTGFQAFMALQATFTQANQALVTITQPLNDLYAEVQALGSALSNNPHVVRVAYIATKESADNRAQNISMFSLHDLQAVITNQVRKDSGIAGNGLLNPQQRINNEGDYATLIGKQMNVNSLTVLKGVYEGIVSQLAPEKVTSLKAAINQNGQGISADATTLTIPTLTDTATFASYGTLAQVIINDMKLLANVIPDAQAPQDQNPAPQPNPVQQNQNQAPQDQGN